MSSVIEKFDDNTIMDIILYYKPHKVSQSSLYTSNAIPDYKCNPASQT